MSNLIHTRSDGRRMVRLDPAKRVLFLTKDLELIRRQLAGELNLRMEDVDPADLLDDINTDVMTPAWVCFRHRPEDIALDAYAGLVDENGERVFPARALLDGGFQVIVSGQRKGTGSSRETAPQAEKWCGIELVIAASFAPIHERNNVNLGQLMGGYDQLARLQAGAELPLEELTGGYDPFTRAILEAGGLFPFVGKVRAGVIQVPLPTTERRAMTMAEKLIASHLVGATGEHWVAPGDSALVKVDGGYSHEFTTAQVHYFLAQEYGADYGVVHPEKFAVFEDHLLYADGVKKMMPFADQIQTLRDLQREFQRHTGVRDYSARDGVSPGICHQVAREQFIDPGDFIQATDSHTCMGGGNNALAYGVGATEYAALVYSGFTLVKVPESIRFELSGQLPANVTAKDVMLYILKHHATREDTLDRVMEFGGSGLASLDMDERATLTNMATECSAKSGICEGDSVAAEWIAARRPGTTPDAIAARFVTADPGAGVRRRPPRHRPGAHPADGRHARRSDLRRRRRRAGRRAHRHRLRRELHGGQGARPRLLRARAPRSRGRRPARRRGRTDVRSVRQRERVRDYARSRGYVELFERAGVQVIDPGCGACIGCGPGVSDDAEQVTVSAINRNFAGPQRPRQALPGVPR